MPRHKQAAAKYEPASARSQNLAITEVYAEQDQVKVEEIARLVWKRVYRNCRSPLCCELINFAAAAPLINVRADIFFKPRIKWIFDSIVTMFRT